MDVQADLRTMTPPGVCRTKCAMAIHSRKESNEVADNQKTSFVDSLMVTNSYIRARVNHTEVLLRFVVVNISHLVSDSHSLSCTVQGYPTFQNKAHDSLFMFVALFSFNFILCVCVCLWHRVMRSFSANAQAAFAS